MTIAAALLAVCPLPEVEPGTPFRYEAHVREQERRAAIIIDATRGTRVSPWLAVSLVREESNCDAGAVHPRTKATGLTQLLPKYFRHVDLFDPEANLRAGIRYLDWRIKRCRGRVAGGLSTYNGRARISGCRPSVFSDRVLRRWHSLKVRNT